MTQRQSEFFEIVFGQIRKDGVVDMMFYERLGVLAQAMSSQPLSQFTGRPRHCTDLGHKGKSADIATRYARLAVSQKLASETRCRASHHADCDDDCANRSRHRSSH